MTDTASAKRPNYSRPTKYPASIPRIMTTRAQRRELDEIHEKTGQSLGEIVRALLDDGLVLLDVPAETRIEVQRLAREAGVTEAEAMTTMLDFAAKESRRRIERDRLMAAELARQLTADGVPFDGVGFGTADIRFER